MVIHNIIVAAGETFSLEINLRNPKKASVYRISATLLQIVSGGGFSKRTAVLQKQNLDRHGLFRAEKLLRHSCDRREYHKSQSVAISLHLSHSAETVP